MALLFPEGYFEVNKKKGLSQAQTMAAYLGGSAFQTVMDNPVTAYRQLVQQYAKDLQGNVVDPKVTPIFLLPSRHATISPTPPNRVHMKTISAMRTVLSVPSVMAGPKVGGGTACYSALEEETVPFMIQSLHLRFYVKEY